MEYVNCNLCNSNNIKLLFKAADLYFGISQEKFNVVKCKNCGLIYLNPRPSVNELEKFYPQTYFSKYGKFINKIRNFIFRNEANKFKNFITENSKVLDIGCGVGELLNVFKNKFNCNVIGIEPNVYAQSLLKEKNIRYFSALEYIIQNENQFDLVILRHVLEHLSSPKDTLLIINRLLKRSGLLYLCLPIAETLEQKIFKKYWAGYDIPRHLYTFSFKTIKRLLIETGFEILYIKYDSIPNYWMLGIHHFLFERTYPKNLINFFNDKKNFLLLAIFFPLSFIFATAKISGQIKLVALKTNKDE